MKDTPYANDFIRLIENVITTLNIYSADNEIPYICLHPDEDIVDFNNLETQLSKVKLTDIRSEFIDTLEDYSKMFFQIKLFELKFEPLLAWPHNFEPFSDEEYATYQFTFKEHLSLQSEEMRIKYESEFVDLENLYIRFCIVISRLKNSFRYMLNEFQTIAQLYLESNNLQLVPSKTEESFQKRIANTLTEVKIASKHKTDVIKILSAMYDCRLFVDAQGKPITNKQELMEAFGAFFGEDFKSYSTLLSQSKDKEYSTFIKPFEQLSTTIKKYYEAE